MQLLNWFDPGFEQAGECGAYLQKNFIVSGAPDFSLPIGGNVCQLKGIGVQTLMAGGIVFWRKLVETP